MTASIVGPGATPDDVVQYWVDDADRLVRVSGAWNSFAVANGSPELVSDEILLRPVWDFISDPTTRQLYRTMVKRVRIGGVPIRFRFRCDAPEWRRLLEMKITREPDDGLRYQVTPVRSEHRPPVLLLQADQARDDSVLTACGWCERIRLGEVEWVPVEVAVRALHLFEGTPMPGLSHGICPPCFETLMAAEAAEQDPARPIIVLGDTSMPG